MGKITIFDFFKQKEGLNSLSFFYPVLKSLSEYYKDSNETELFYVNKDSKIDFVIIRVLILTKKFLGENELIKVYKTLTDNVLNVRNFLIKNKINDENKITQNFIQQLKKQKNFLLLSPGEFKAEDILFSKIDENETKENKKIENKDKTEKKSFKDFEIRNKEIIIYDDKGKIFKIYPSFITKTNKKLTYINPYIKDNDEFYYLGKYSFGKNIDVSEIDNLDEKMKKILLQLIKNIKETKNVIN